jgi:hypothetical protein
VQTVLYSHDNTNDFNPFNNSEYEAGNALYQKGIIKRETYPQNGIDNGL